MATGVVCERARVPSSMGVESRSSFFDIGLSGGVVEMRVFEIIEKIICLEFQLRCLLMMAEVVKCCGN